MAFGSVLNLSTLNGSNGFALNGVNADDQSGFSVSGAGDINGDGTDDLLIGASYADPNGGGSGQSYVVFGSSNSLASAINLSTLNGSNGFALNGVNAYDDSGRSVSGAGDINGDGTDDLLIGAWAADPNGSLSGQSYVVFGSSNPLASSLNLSSLNGSNGFALNGVNAYDRSGFSVSGAGDINGDGTDDILIGASYADPNGGGSGQSYVVFGSSNGLASSLNLSTLNGSNGFALNGVNADDQSGTSVSGAGDINGDGKDDLIIGAWAADPNGSLSGQSYVVFGSSNGLASSLNLSTLNGSNGFALNGVKAYDYSGYSVRGAGDINGDGTDDLIIGAWAADPNGSLSGQSYVVFGSSNPLASSLNLSTLNGSNGFALNGVNAYDQSGRSVSGAGDINGDGTDDLIIGAYRADPNGSNSGQSYVVFGSSNGFASSLNLSTLNGSKGFTLNGVNADDRSGISVSGAGDINGDGTDDLLIGARNADPNGSNSGQNYVVFGQASTSIIEGDNNDNLLNGTSGDDTIIGYGGNDTLNGYDGNDSLDGGADNDTLDGGTGNDTLNGGTGNDTYIIDSLNDVIEETSTVTTEIDTVETNLTYTLFNNLENLTLTGSSNIDGVGNSLDNILTGNIGNNSLTGGLGNDTYIINSSDDVITETSTIATEIDNVQSSATYTLSNNLENLTLTGSSNLEGVGNDLDNSITGNSGNNIIRGGKGKDTLMGNVGNDYLGGGDQDDSLVGGVGNDTVYGGFDNDFISGGDGNDLLSGDGGKDSINGGEGNDYIDGGTWYDTMVGGEGNDTYIVDSFSDVLNETSTTTTEIDTVQSGATYTLGANLENLTLTGSSNIDGVGNSLDNSLTGNSGNNTLNGLAGNDTLTGGLGNNTYIIDSSSDVVSETSSIATEIDNVQSSVTYTLGTNLENLVLTGSSNLNGIGNSRNNSLTGNSGNNTLDGLTGNDTLTGGLGNDTYVVDSSADVISETSTLVTEIDNVQSSATYTLTNNLENLTLTGSSNLEGVGNELDNSITGNSGNNIIRGGKGKDTLIGNMGNDYLGGGDQDDSLVGGVGNDTVYGGFENDSIFGGDGNDLLSGDGGKDSINGGIGKDYIDGGAWYDTMIGGEGNDTYIVDSFSDVINETITTTTEIDEVRNTGDFSLSANLENLILLGSANIFGTGNSLENIITGNTGDNFLTGGDGADTITGFDGNDRLKGDAGSDTLTGGNGNDTLIGYGDANEIDTLTGGAGNDVFFLGDATTIFYDGDNNSGYGLMTDFATGDKIQLKSPSSNYELVKSINFLGSTAKDTAIVTTDGDIIGIVQDETSLITSLSSNIFIYAV